jgi:hypothetical protein
MGGLLLVLIIQKVLLHPPDRDVVIHQNAWYKFCTYVPHF